MVTKIAAGTVMVTVAASEVLLHKSVAVTDGPRLVEPLRELGYDNVVAELDAHSKTLGTDKIVDSDFGLMIRSAIDWIE